MKEKKEEEEDGWTCSSYSFAAYAGSCLFFLEIIGGILLKLEISLSFDKKYLGIIQGFQR